MAINEHPPPREELSTTEDEDDGAVEYHDELLRTDDGEITRAAKKQAISAKLPTASVAPPLGPPLPHTLSTPVKITPSTSPSDIIVGKKDKARLVGKILQGQQSGRLKMSADHQFQMEGRDHPTAKLSRSAGSASLARARKTPATITRSINQSTWPPRTHTRTGILGRQPIHASRSWWHCRSAHTCYHNGLNDERSRRRRARLGGRIKRIGGQIYWRGCCYLFQEKTTSPSCSFPDINGFLSPS
ncbi:hypothetical protein Pst134EB_012578 [Puccinia striiformis f. sp. tritici]|nr:hypothetical protein Pst134EB_012578 [Puccinia striiformis f. sp. tritici]